MEEDKSGTSRRKRTSDDNARELWHWKYNYNSKNIVTQPELADTMNVQNKSNFTLSLPDTNPPTDSVEFKTKIIVV